MKQYFSTAVVVALLRTSSTLLFAKDLSSASVRGSNGYAVRQPYGVKVAFVVWSRVADAGAPTRDNGRAANATASQGQPFPTHRERQLPEPAVNRIDL